MHPKRYRPHTRQIYPATLNLSIYSQESTPFLAHQPPVPSHLSSIRVQSNLIQHGTCALWASGHLLHSHQSRMFRFEHHDDRPRPRWLPYTRSEAFLHIGPFNKCVIAPLTRPRSRERITLTRTHFFCSGACQFHCNRMQARICASNNGKKGHYAPKQGV